MANGAAGPTPLLPEALDMINVTVLRVFRTNSGDPARANWKGLTAGDMDVMVSGLLGGCPEKVRPFASVPLEGIETVAPFKPFKLAQGEWDALIPVASPEEAWARDNIF